AAAAAASAQAGPGFAQGLPISQERKPSGITESAPAGYPEPAPPRRALSPYVLAGALVLLVALGIGIWWARRPAPAPAPNPVSQTTGAAAFGIEYMQKRDSAQTAAAYDMTGPTFRKHWSGDNFGAAVAALDSRQGRAAKYDPQGTCTERERGAFTCEYLVSYADGSLKKHALVIAKHNGGWVIASDSALGTR
ncbi:MAG: hypothetical protein JO211_15080, partial [Acidobacteriaceae bacterium]|nr:hypothetical protein [Acidobacteriaceae bacterium]